MRQRLLGFGGMRHRSALRANALRTGGMALLMVALASVLAPNATASITPTMSLDQSAGTTAGSTTNLGVDLKFAPGSGDSPEHLTLNLPPGLLANASIDGGACLKTADLTDSACQVGSGTVTADAVGPIPISTPVTIDLVPPPQAGDLAGLAVNSNGSQIGATADVRVRPSGDPRGVGVTINFVLPNSLYGVPISITEISSTFDGVRYPTACPSPPQNFTIAADSYNDPTVHTATAPLSVTGCSSLPYAPSFAVTATRDPGDSQVELTTQTTQTPREAPSRSITLVMPSRTLEPNLKGLGILCPNLSVGTCTPAGSVTATSPLYPTPLTGQAYFTGSFAEPTLTLTFPSPFQLTLVGSVDLNTLTTTFTGLPDIPLTNLLVTLYGGARGLFSATCVPPSGTAKAILSDQNGDRTVNEASSFIVSGCPGTASGLKSGHPSLSFQVRVGKHAVKLRSLAIGLPAGLSFTPGATRHGGVTLTGAQLGSLSLSHGRLVIKLRKPASSLGVRISTSALRESAALRRAASHLRRLRLTVVTDNVKGHRATIHVQVRNPRL